MRTTIGLRYWRFEKNDKRRRLAAYLVLGIVQIGQKLDFRDRHKAIMPHPDGEAQYGLFVEQCIKHPRRAEFLLQTLGHPVHPALARHIFAKQRDIGVAQHQIGERKVDGLRQRHRLGQIALILGKQRITGRCIR